MVVLTVTVLTGKRSARDFFDSESHIRSRFLEVNAEYVLFDTSLEFRDVHLED